uniref:F-box/LRR-repeat protein 25-like n=1 Tax=Nicotiana tabacum TaxID=4097 RepID=A0A1S4BJJ6_TOBAC|nr:PREDICTED: F-box/LRR-repeat protein 25-like [Nicotiana tabacum]
MASGNCSNNSKKQKVRINSAEETLDRLSELPESLLIQILSSADKGCTHNINYNVSELENFRSFVDYVLAHSVSPKIKAFELDCLDLDEYASEVSRWPSFAVEKKVENVLLWSHSDYNACPLPEFFYTCSSLKTLVLTGCDFDDDMVIAWKSLKSMTLKYMVLSN